MLEGIRIAAMTMEALCKRVVASQIAQGPRQSPYTKAARLNIHSLAANTVVKVASDHEYGRS